MTETVRKSRTMLVARRIRAARKEAKITNRELAARLGITERAVLRYQDRRNPSEPSYDRLRELAEILGKPPSYFLDDEPAAA